MCQDGGQWVQVIFSSLSYPWIPYLCLPLAECWSLPHDCDLVDPVFPGHICCCHMVLGGEVWVPPEDVVLLGQFGGVVCIPPICVDLTGNVCVTPVTPVGCCVLGNVCLLKFDDGQAVGLYQLSFDGGSLCR